MLNVRRLYLSGPLMLSRIYCCFAVTDQSGMKFFYTKDESGGLDPGAAFFSVAHRISVFHLIPPQAESYKDTAFCSSECTSTVRYNNQREHTWGHVVKEIF